ncbi:VENN motif pre-toxin domain-containing protein [Cronobacter muytjensii]|nr:VENN motif pre-toxin domain-containing protein [Cronobacter muytjensii]
MDETEKQTVAALSTLASGLAGNSTEAVATAAKAGQTTVENNFLHAKKSLILLSNRRKLKHPRKKESYNKILIKLTKSFKRKQKNGEYQPGILKPRWLV